MKKNIQDFTPNELGLLPAKDLNFYLQQLRVKHAGMKARNDEKLGSLSASLSLKKINNTDKVTAFLPGNIEDLNKVVWPFLFQTPIVTVPPDSVLSSNINVTQEAAFVITHITKVVFEQIDLGGGNFNFVYMNPQVEASNSAAAPGMFFSIIDSQSTRSWVDEPIPLSVIGDSRNPFYFETPYMVLQNQNIEVRFNNDNATRTFMPSIAFHGYRLRLEEAQGILSLQSN